MDEAYPKDEIMRFDRKSDDKRVFHDHPSDFISIILKGSYTNVTPEGRKLVTAGSIWYANWLHYLDIPRGGAWTLILTGKRYNKWGFFVNGKRLHPSKYFKKYKIPPCDCQ